MFNYLLMLSSFWIAYIFMGIIPIGKSSMQGFFLAFGNSHPVNYADLDNYLLAAALWVEASNNMAL